MTRAKYVPTGPLTFTRSRREFVGSWTGVTEMPPTPLV